MLHPIALRQAKIVYNFGLSECNRINTLQVACLIEVATKTGFTVLETDELMQVRISILTMWVM